MGRLALDSRERMQKAALFLCSNRRFDDITAAEIASSAGVTERTFFRHFQDKRDVLFVGFPFVAEAIVVGIESSDPSEAIFSRVRGGVVNGVVHLAEFGRDFPRTRQRVIDESQSLRERELTKLGELSVSIRDTLLSLECDRLTATILGDVAVGAFWNGFRIWIDGDDEGGTLGGAIESVFRIYASIGCN